MKDSYELSGPKVIPLVDPKTDEELKLTKDGYFQNPRTKDIFAVNDSGFVIELKDPETNYIMAYTIFKNSPADKSGLKSGI